MTDTGPLMIHEVRKNENHAYPAAGGSLGTPAAFFRVEREELTYPFTLR